MSKSLGKILQRLRKEQGMSQKELSQGLCSVTTLSRFWEKIAQSGSLF